MVNIQLNMDSNGNVVKGSETLTIYWENGNLKWVETRMNGVRNGTYKIYYESGQLWSIGAYKDGKLEGFCRWYDEDGTLVAKSRYVNGQFFFTHLHLLTKNR